MNGKKIIKKIWIPVLSVFFVSLLAVILYRPYQKIQFEEHKEDLKRYMQEFNKKNNEYLESVAIKIKSLPVNPVLINGLESEYMVDHQQEFKSKKYLWFEGTDNQFFFGVPQKAFRKLIEGYDKNVEIIQKDGFYSGKNDFLLKLIDQYQNIDFSEFSKTEPEQYWSYKWRYYRDIPDYRYSRSLSTAYSKSVIDASGKIIGTLYLKVTDLENEKYYVGTNNDYDGHYYEDDGLYSNVFPFFVFLLVVSSLFIWFLMPTWVYIDAQQRNLPNALTWAVLTLIGIFFGLIIYLITRPSAIKTLNCPHCENELNGTRAYCPHCGYDLTSTFCQACDYPIKPEWKFCPSCRTETKLAKNLKNEFNNKNLSENS